LVKKKESSVTEVSSLKHFGKLLEHLPFTLQDGCPGILTIARLDRRGGYVRCAEEVHHGCEAG
jgi:hypothetical protein